MLSTLIDLAREGSSEKRRELMGHVASLFVAGADRYRDEEIALFNGVLSRLVDLVDDSDKEELSEKLSRIDATPHDLVYKLADERAEIARYMLQYSNVLTMEDLIRFAKVKGQEQLLALSKRAHLEARLTDILLERGEQKVRRSVAANSGAELSAWGTRLLVKIAEKDPVLRESMVCRSDLTPQHFDRLIDQMPEDQSKKVRHLYETNTKLVEDLFHEAGQVVAKSKLDRKRSRLDAKVAIREISLGNRSLNTVFVEYALSNHLADLAYLLSGIADVDQKYVLNAMLRKEADGIAILCRALEIREMEFSAFCKARCSLLGLPANVADNWASTYSTINTQDSQRVLRFIKARLKMMETAAA
jgi:hypothetical protein